MDIVIRLIEIFFTILYHNKPNMILTEDVVFKFFKSNLLSATPFSGKYGFIAKEKYEGKNICINS